MCVLPFLWHSTQVNISEWCKGKKDGGGGHIQLWLQQKMGDVPHFYPSLPSSSPHRSLSLLLLPHLSYYHDMCLRPFIHPLPFIILPINPVRLSPCYVLLPCKREPHILHNKHFSSPTALSVLEEDTVVLTGCLSTTTTNSMHCRQPKMRQWLVTCSVI